ncbi:DUF3592 domain-containing protein [Streptomyces sp. NPDC057245]|uniref:DUF3592 domain-containing protein n=1 Tax=Streptomyces TaxID=1883 RepID=UPI001C1E2780|nr:DUF3592 domain-containing protein [Streptomyces sp. A108]MBU6535943.1 DUF3592 domain-containing protein [Streptomyces sp. A108]
MTNTVMGVLLCGLVGVLLLWAGLYDAARVRRLRRHGIRTTGMVVDNVRVQGSQGSGPSWAPIVAFADHHGYRVEFTPSMRGAGMGLPTGRQVAVVYLPQNPQAARVFTRRHMTGPVYFVLAMATLFLIASVAIAATA